MVILIILLIVVVIVAIFSVQNAAPVAITFLFWKFEASLAIVLFLTVIAGILAGVLIVMLFKMRPSHNKNREDL
jgi:putative membrane protein